MDKTTNQLINQLHLDAKKENAVRKLVENAGRINNQTPLVNEVIGDELIPINQNGENKAVTVEQIKNNILSVPSSYEFVDLGLPSGIKWATCNIGASKPEEFGLYFAWGETNGYTVAEVKSGIKSFSWEDYKFTNDGGDTFTKYSKEDNKRVLDLEDDGAYQYDNTCRTPTKDEYDELIINTTQVIEELNGITGMKFISKINNNSIFIPSSGTIEYNEFYPIENKQLLWTSQLDKDYDDWACLFNAVDGEAHVDYMSRFYGLAIRPVQFKSSTVVDLNDIVDKINTINNNINDNIYDIKQKTDKIEIDGDGDKFLSDDGVYRAINANNNTNYYIWDGSISETIYNELVNCYNKGIPVIYKKDDVCVATRIKYNSGKVLIYTYNRLYAADNRSVTEYGKGIGSFDANTGKIKTNIYNIYKNIITTDTTIRFENTYTEEGVIFEGEFSFGDSVYNITFNKSIKWSTDSVTEYKPNHTYYFKIICTNNKNIGIMKEFAN